MDELTDNSTARHFKNLSRPTGEGVVIDLGTGDGTFVYQSARRNPSKFYLGIDANPRPLEKISKKIHRKPAKGGAPNALFLQHAVEDLPVELAGFADEVHVHFPWGSLLRAVAVGDVSVMSGIRRICSPDALLEVVVGSDPERDQAELNRLGVPPVTLDLVDTLVDPYRAAGFEIFERGVIAPADWPKFHTAWAKRLQFSSTRSLIYWIARAID
ncbi:MAG: methyltransferase domain-containing protein [Pyrinomonadaceae bacterium]